MRLIRTSGNGRLSIRNQSVMVDISLLPRKDVTHVVSSTLEGTSVPQSVFKTHGVKWDIGIKNLLQRPDVEFWIVR